MSYKMYILIRTDKKYSAGKICVHVAHHNSLTAILKFSTYTNPLCFDIIKKWYDDGQTKIILSVDNLTKMQSFYNKAIDIKCSCSMIEDLGLYEVPAGEIIACAILCSDDNAKQLGLKKLSLYKGENIKCR